ncbi:peptide deformylase [Clostridium cavendishii DSM 21758]|uniref:Peptide deformylase n=1 Tax=Clostridium cavendishii DSM 21758 TaxID=1121302 RepID=A0A1M6ESG5_9CLOT|nr:peptide deformylase [Clostridium cavendishii]SHI88392.1 peptide deformylase [Clostridium cavendishii DSM 21758]
MAIRKIVQLGDEHLKNVSEPVTEINEEIRGIIQDLKDTLYSVDGVGLAAPQIAVNKRIVFIDLRDGSMPLILINPEITHKEGSEVDYEGCLSYVGYEGTVERPTKVIVEAYNEEGKQVAYEAEGLMARCFCHEIDHLHGVMYVDRAIEMYELEDEE